MDQTVVGGSSFWSFTFAHCLNYLNSIETSLKKNPVVYFYLDGQGCDAVLFLYYASTEHMHVCVSAWATSFSSIHSCAGVCVCVCLQGVNRVVKDAQVGRDGERRKDWHDYEAIKRDASRSGESRPPYIYMHVYRVTHTHRHTHTQFLPL